MPCPHARTALQDPTGGDPLLGGPVWLRVCQDCGREVPALGAADRLVPEDYKPRISEEERSTIPSYGELIVERLEDLGAFTVSRRPLQSEALDLLALTADYPVEHPLRQAAARLTTRLALAEGKVATAAEALERATSTTYAPDVEHHLARALEILKR